MLLCCAVVVVLIASLVRMAVDRVEASGTVISMVQELPKNVRRT